MEACRSAHYWACCITKLGHTARLLPAHYLKAYVKRNKTDRADAAAILEAARSPDMQVVPIKTVEQQQIQSLHRLRSQWLSTRVPMSSELFGYKAGQSEEQQARDRNECRRWATDQTATEAASGQPGATTGASAKEAARDGTLSNGRAYFHAILESLAWLEAQNLTQIVDIEPLHMAACIEQLSQRLARPCAKQHLAAFRMLLD